MAIYKLIHTDNEEHKKYCGKIGTLVCIYKNYLIFNMGFAGKINIGMEKKRETNAVGTLFIFTDKYTYSFRQICGKK